MTRPVNGILAVAEFINSGPGEYQFENAVYSSQTDATGSGSFAITAGHLLYVQATDINVALPITGVYHRYKLTSVSTEDGSLLSGTMVWDEPGDEEDVPTNGSICLVAEPTSLNRIGIPSLDTLYPDVAPGASLAALLLDVRFIIDQLTGNGSGADISNLITDVATIKETTTTLTQQVEQTATEVATLQPLVEEASKIKFYTHQQEIPATTWTINHNKGSSNFVYTLLDSTGQALFPDSLRVLDNQSLELKISQELTGSLTLMFHA